MLFYTAIHNSGKLTLPASKFSEITAALTAFLDLELDDDVYTRCQVLASAIQLTDNTLNAFIGITSIDVSLQDGYYIKLALDMYKGARVKYPYKLITSKGDDLTVLLVGLPTAEVKHQSFIAMLDSIIETIRSHFIAKGIPGFISWDHLRDELKLSNHPELQECDPIRISWMVPVKAM